MNPCFHDHGRVGFFNERKNLKVHLTADLRPTNGPQFLNLRESEARALVNRARALYPNYVIHVVWSSNVIIDSIAYDFTRERDLQLHLFMSDRFGGNLTPPDWMREPGAPTVTREPVAKAPSPRKLPPEPKEVDAFTMLMEDDFL